MIFWNFGKKLEIICLTFQNLGKLQGKDFILFLNVENPRSFLLHAKSTIHVEDIQ